MRRISTALMILVCFQSSLVTVRGQSAPAPPSATVPRLIHITGAFQPVDGRAPAPVEIVIVSIYADQDGGLPVWQERQSVTVEPKTGHFTLLLGESYPDGIPAGVFGAGQARWMSLLFERLGEVEQRRVRIASVPYALKASDAETLGGLPASAYLRAPAAGNPASSDVAKNDPSLVVTSIETPGADVLPGTTNFLAKYVNGSDVGNSAVYESGGAVGIGTTTPLDQLHVRFTNTNGAFTGLALQNLGGTSTSFSGMLFYDQLGALGQFQGFNNGTHEYRINNIARSSPGGLFDGSINFMTGSTSRLFVATNGNIGIGTAAPAQKLHVAGDVAVDGNIMSGNGTPGGTLSAGQVNAVSQFNIGGVRILAVPGSDNVVAGPGSGAALTSGSDNAFFGAGAGAANTSGLANTFVGSDAGVQNSTGQQNSFFGFEAGAASTTATRNSFFGSGAGRVTTGGSNTFFGGAAGVSNTTGTSNVFVGTGAANGNTTGSENVFVGAFTGHDSVSTADQNVLVGFSAGRTNRGEANTFVGNEAGRDNTTGSANTFVGSESGLVATAGTLNAFFGWNAGKAATTGSSNAFIGASSGTTNTTGGGNTLIGAFTDVAASNLTFATAIGASSVALASDTIVLGRSAGQDAVHIWGTLRVGLDGAGALDVCRNASFRLSTCSSSIRYKQQIETYGAGMQVVRRLRPITFTWKSDGARDLGFAAEEVAAIDPLLAIYTDEGQVEGVKYKQLTTVLVNAANEQQRQIEQQQKQIDKQQRQIDALLHLVCGQNPAAELCSESRDARNR